MANDKVGKCLHLNPRCWLVRKRKSDLGISMEKWRSFLQSDFGGNLGQIGIVRALRKMRQYDVVRPAVKPIAQPIGNILVGQMAQARQDSLLQFPRIDLARLQHVPAVIGFDHHSGATPQTFTDERCNMAEIQQRCDLHARVGGREAEIVYGIMWDGEGMKINFANAKVFA